VERFHLAVWRGGASVTGKAESVLWLQRKRDEKKSPVLPNLHRITHTTNIDTHLIITFSYCFKQIGNYYYIATFNKVKIRVRFSKNSLFRTLSFTKIYPINPLSPELNLICYLLALLAHDFFSTLAG
jgi:hypothetical protein